MRALKIFTKPFLMLQAKINPVKYARKIGVRTNGDLHIYGSSYSMFNSEPWLISLGRNVHITGGVQFITHDGGTLVLRQIVPDLELTFPIDVGDNVYIGMRCIILPGVRIGNNVIVGAGSIVSRDIPDNSVAVGNPARVIKSVDEYLEKAKLKSLHFGNLSAKEKENKLREYYSIRKT